jgi:hypothetical protein
MPNTWKYVYSRSETGAVYQGGAGSWEQHSADWGNGTKPIVLWHLDGEYAVFKVPAGRYFRNITDRQASTPGQYVVCRILDKRGPNPDVLITEELFTMPVSEQGRKPLPTKENTTSNG